MRKSGVGSGGGYGSRNVVDKPVRTGAGSKGIRPSYTNAPGSLYGDHVTNRDSTGYRGPKREDGKSFQPVAFGNAVALNVGKGGVGTGRTLYGQAGSQGTHGSTNPARPRPAGRDILSQFGPDKRSY